MKTPMAVVSSLTEGKVPRRTVAPASTCSASARRSRSPTSCARQPGSDPDPRQRACTSCMPHPLSPHPYDRKKPIMTSWTDHDLRAIAETPDCFVSPFREDETTYGTPTRVWPLVVDGDVYVRAANGQTSTRAAQP